MKKADYELAVKLDSSEINNIESIFFWFLIEKSDKGEFVAEIWLDQNTIPKKYQGLMHQKLRLHLSKPDIIIMEELKNESIKILGHHEIKKIRKNSEVLTNKISKISNRETRSNNVKSNIIRNHVRQQRVVQNVYLNGVPPELACRIFVPARLYRKNPLSHIKGGSDVIVEYQGGEVFLYDWIKYPSRYIETIFVQKIGYTKTEYKQLNYLEQISYAKSTISNMFLRYFDESKRTNKNDIAFEHIWNSEESTELPWESMEKFINNKYSLNNMYTNSSYNDNVSIDFNDDFWKL